MSIESLPDPLLGRIFAAAGRQAGVSHRSPSAAAAAGFAAVSPTSRRCRCCCRCWQLAAAKKALLSSDVCLHPAQHTVTLVSRRWHHVFFSEPALWRELELAAKSLIVADEQGQAAQWFAAKARLLPRVGGFVQRLRYQGPGWGFSDDWQLNSSVLAHFSPSTLQSLHLEYAEVDAAAAEALQQFTGLTHLVADSGANSCLVAALPSLPQLQSLSLSDIVPPGLPAALQQLIQLTELSCTAAGPLPDLSTLFLLTQLRKLDWEAGSLQVDVQQLLARLPQLESCSLATSRVDSVPYRCAGRCCTRATCNAR